MEDFDEREDRLWRALMRLNGALPRLLEDDLARGTGLTLSEFGVLLVLTEAENGSLRMSDLAAAAGISPSRVTRVVSELERRGLVEKMRSAQDARSAMATVTQAGGAAVRAAYPVQVDRARKVLFQHLAPAEVEATIAVLEPLLSRVVAESRRP
jgi:DNA-binding MarR family transcriptional regulator